MRIGLLARSAGRILPNRDGMAAVEFALFTPVFCLLIVGVVDLGGVLYTKFKLDSAVTAAANFAQINAASVTSSAGPGLANNIATLVEASEGSAWADDVIVVNNGPSTTVSGGAATSGGTAANADACYCPSGPPGSLSWGASKTCGAACTGLDTGYAGKFVVITATRQYTPIFTSYGLVQDNTISASAAVQVQ
jgi:Flp pilus assembly protein TadG